MAAALNLTSAIYIFLCLLSYYPFDPSVYTSPSIIEEIENFGGLLGAHIAAVGILSLGWVAFIIPTILISTAIVCIRPNRFNLMSTCFFWLYGATLICIWLPSISPIRVDHGVEIPSVGSLGKVVSENFLRYFGEGGAITLTCGFMIFFAAQLSNLGPVKRVFSRRLKLSLSQSNLEEGRHKKIESLEKKTPAGTTEAPSSQTLFLSSKNSNPIDQGCSSEASAKKYSSDLVKVLLDFGIQGRIDKYRIGPSVIVFEFIAKPGTKISKILTLTEDLALGVGVESVLVQPLNSQGAIGIQIPNPKPYLVRFGDLIQSKSFLNNATPLPFLLGSNLKGEAICHDIRQLPHLLIAGQTGSGKSVAINSLLCSVLYRSDTSHVRLLLIDPKILELKLFDKVPHLLKPVVTEPMEAHSSLEWLCVEMDRRYNLLEKLQTRHIDSFNKKIKSKPSLVNLLHQEGYDTSLKTLPYILVVVDELADLMLVSSKDIENSIQRLAQKARACGIHLVLATQRPSVDVITGVIKANLPSRISFKVFSRVDSRTVLDTIGSHQLLGKGDMLFLKSGAPNLERIQGCFLTDEEVEKFCDSLSTGDLPPYHKDLGQKKNFANEEPSLTGEIPETLSHKKIAYSPVVSDHTER